MMTMMMMMPIVIIMMTPMMMMKIIMIIYKRNKINKTHNRAHCERNAVLSLTEHTEHAYNNMECSSSSSSSSSVILLRSLTHYMLVYNSLEQFETNINLGGFDLPYMILY